MLEYVKWLVIFNKKTYTRRTASATRSACAIGATSCTRTTSAPLATAITLEAIVPPRRSLDRGAVDLADEALARGADDDRAAEVAQLAQPRQQLEVVLERLAEADPGVDRDPLLGDAGGERELDPLGEEGA